MPYFFGASTQTVENSELLARKWSDQELADETRDQVAAQISNMAHSCTVNDLERPEPGDPSVELGSKARERVTKLPSRRKQL